MLSLWPRICMLRTCYNPYFPRQVKSIYIYIYYVTKHASHFRGRPISKTHRVFPARCNLPSRRHVPDIRAQSTSPMAIELLESNLWNHNTNEQYGVNGMCRAINESCLGYIRKQICFQYDYRAMAAINIGRWVNFVCYLGVMSSSIYWT